VAGFLGLPPMNMIQGWTAQADGTLSSDVGLVPIPEHLRELVTPGQELIVGFRSSDATLDLDGQRPGQSLIIPAEVLNAEPNFARHYQLINVQAGDVIFGVQMPLDATVNSGWKVDVVIPQESVLLFDAETDRRLGYVEPEVAESEQIDN